MSAPTDPTEPTAPRDPADYGRPRLMSPIFWVAIAFCLFCVAAGVTVVVFRAYLFPAPAPAAAPAPAREEPSAHPAPAASLSLETNPAPTASDRLARLDSRIDQLEAAQIRVAERAAGALAASALIDASQTSRPFPDELAALAAVSPPSAELRSLRRLAETGAPSRAVLAAEFGDYAARAAGASHAAGGGSGLLGRIQAALAQIVVVRRVGDTRGSGPDDVLARAERQVQDGEIELALRTLNDLPPAGRDAIAPWRARAEQRAEIDRRVAAVRAEALEDLARLARRGA